MMNAPEMNVTLKTWPSRLTHGTSTQIMDVLQLMIPSLPHSKRLYTDVSVLLLTESARRTHGGAVEASAPTLPLMAYTNEELADSMGALHAAMRAMIDRNRIAYDFVNSIFMALLPIAAARLSNKGK